MIRVMSVVLVDGLCLTGFSAVCKCGCAMLLCYVAVCLPSGSVWQASMARLE